MDFRVEITKRASEEIDAIADYIRQRGSFESAEKWLRDISHSLTTLSYLAGIHPVVPESGEVGRRFHILLHGAKNRRYKVFLLARRHAPRRQCSSHSPLGTQEPNGGGTWRIHVRLTKSPTSD